MITHHVEELLPETSHVLVLKNGHGRRRWPAQKVLTSATLSHVYDCPVKVSHRDGRTWLQVRSAAWKKVI